MAAAGSEGTHPDAALPPLSQGLMTDLYQFTMSAGYFQKNLHNQVVTCEAFVRSLPKERNFLVMCGTASIMRFLRSLRFSETDIAFLKSIPQLRGAFTTEFEQYLRTFRFRGDVWALDEGTVFFANEPVLRITAPIIEAQLVETYVLSILNSEIKVASKAARVVQAADGRTLIEMGSRRTSPEAAVASARAAYIAGFDATSNVAAAQLYGVPLAGTVAHMWTMAHAEADVPRAESELRAFRAFVDVFACPTLLIDSYNTESGLNNAITAAGTQLAAVRIDSGDLEAETRAARARLDEAGLKGARIVLSGGLDEHVIARLLAAETPVDAFGVGENVSSPPDAAITGFVYKMVANETRGIGVAKTSAGGKSTAPFAKQVWRWAGGDIVTLAREPPPVPDAAPPLRHYMREGQLLVAVPNVEQAREHCRRQLQLVRWDGQGAWPVSLSEALERARDEASKAAAVRV